jgi:hypothetical protein
VHSDSALVEGRLVGAGAVQLGVGGRLRLAVYRRMSSTGREAANEGAARARGVVRGAEWRAASGGGGLGCASVSAAARARISRNPNDKLVATYFYVPCPNGK